MRRLPLIELFIVCALGTVLPPPAAAEASPATLALKDLSWIAVKDAIACGASTVLVPTGGIEQNGPLMVLGKHDYIVAHAAEAIAREIGGTLVSPVVSFVPQGDFLPPSANMRFPGTIGVTEAVFEGLLDNIARSLKAAGFRTILFIGDHGPSQKGQAAVAHRLSLEWHGEGVRVVTVAAYYDDRAQYAALKARGLPLAAIGFHAGLIDTAELLAVRPASVDLTRTKPLVDDLEASGASGAPANATAELGRTLLAMRIAAAIAEIRALPRRD